MWLIIHTQICLNYASKGLPAKTSKQRIAASNECVYIWHNKLVATPDYALWQVADSSSKICIGYGVQSN